MLHYKKIVLGIEITQVTGELFKFNYEYCSLFPE